MIDHAKPAWENFLSGMTCAQSVLCAFEDVTGLDRDTSMRIAASFGGGVGGLREMCGAVSGALVVLGMARGWTDPDDEAAKSAHYERTQTFVRRFRDAEGTSVCAELLSAAGVVPGPGPAPRTPEYYTVRPCTRLVGTAARLLDELLAEARDASRGDVRPD